MNHHYNPTLGAAALVSDYGWTPGLIQRHLLSATNTTTFYEREVIRVMHTIEFAEDMIAEVTSNSEKDEIQAQRRLSRFRRHALTTQHDHWVETICVF